MKRIALYLFVILSLMFSSFVYADEGIKLWGLSEKRLDDESSLTARVGYEFEDFIFPDSNNSIEPFVGFNWVPEKDEVTNDISMPQVFTFGAVYHFFDIVDPNAPLPWINDILVSLIPEETVAKPFIGGQGNWNIANGQVGLQGMIVGITAKAKPEDKLEYVAELDYNNFFGKLDDIKNENDWVLSVGLRFGF